MKNAIPNTITIFNLFCGCLGIVAVFNGDMVGASCFMVASLLLDFCDGFLARKLNVACDFGKQLDSLADMVSFGVLPGVILYQLTSASLGVYYIPLLQRDLFNLFLSIIPLMIILFSALRLAKFNIDDGGIPGYFMGLNTPTNAAFIGSFPVILILQLHINFVTPLTTEMLKATGSVYYWGNFQYFVASIVTNPIFLVSIAVVNSILLVAPIPLFSLKLKNASWQDNKVRYITLAGVGGLLLITVLPYLFIVRGLPFLDYTVIPLIIILYLLISIINNFVKNEI